VEQEYAAAQHVSFLQVTCVFPIIHSPAQQRSLLQGKIHFHDKDILRVSQKHLPSTGASHNVVIGRNSQGSDRPSILEAGGKPGPFRTKLNYPWEQVALEEVF
jgi:hypothetical protein